MCGERVVNRSRPTATINSSSPRGAVVVAGPRRMTAVHEPDTRGLAVATLDGGEPVTQRGLLGDVAGRHFVGHGKPAGLTITATATWTHLPGLSRLCRNGAGWLRRRSFCWPGPPQNIRIGCRSRRRRTPRNECRTSRASADADARRSPPCAAEAAAHPVVTRGEGIWRAPL